MIEIYIIITQQINLVITDLGITFNKVNNKYNKYDLISLSISANLIIKEVIVPNEYG